MTTATVRTPARPPVTAIAALTFSININPTLYPCTTLNGPTATAIEESIPGIFGSRFFPATLTQTPAAHQTTPAAASAAATSKPVRKPMTEARKKELSVAQKARWAMIKQQREGTGTAAPAAETTKPKPRAHRRTATQKTMTAAA